MEPAVPLPLPRTPPYVSPSPSPPPGPSAPRPQPPPPTQTKEIKKSSVAIIKEIYDGENYLAKFEMELEHALEANCAVIVIEPDRLAEITSRWITVGNVLHKVAVITGLTSLATGVMCKNFTCVPFGVTSLLCTSVYTLSWQMDPCCNYQPERNLKRLIQLPQIAELQTTTPLVLVRNENTKKVVTHATIALAASIMCLWKVYKTVY